MKKELLKFTAWVFGLMLIIVAAMSITSCHRNYKEYDPPSDEDSVAVKGYEKPVEYQFLSVNEFLEYKDNLVSEETADSVILYTPDPVLCNVCSVLLKKQSKFTKTELALEYINNRIIYDNITQNMSAYPDNNKDSDIYSEIEYKDTVINGKKCEIVTKFY